MTDAGWDQSGAGMEKTAGGDGDEDDSGGSWPADCAIHELCRHRPCFEVPVYRVRRERWAVALLLIGRQVQQRACGSIRVDVGVAST